jgi:hypothetical protein
VADEQDRGGVELDMAALPDPVQPGALAPGDAPEAGEEVPEAPGRGGLFSRATAAASGLKDQVANKVSDLKDAGIDVALDLVADFNAMLPVLREAGYALRAVDIAVAVPPKLVATFSVGADLEEEKVEALLAANEGKKVTVLALRSLVRARKLQAKIGIAGLQPKGIQLELGLSPQVVVQFG